jgi:hypothetical protein
MTQRSEHSVLHRQSAPQAFIPELEIKAVTGYATSDDGMTSVLRTVTPEGIELRLVIPTVLIEAVITALNAVKIVAAAKTTIAPGETSVFIPQRYETITTDAFDGVLVAFDRGAPSALMVGLSRDAAFDMGTALRKQAREVKTRLILPDTPKEIIS